MSFRVTGKTATGPLVIYAIGTAARNSAMDQMYGLGIMVVSAMRVA